MDFSTLLEEAKSFDDFKISYDKDTMFYTPEDVGITSLLTSLEDYKFPVDAKLFDLGAGDGRLGRIVSSKLGINNTILVESDDRRRTELEGIPSSSENITSVMFTDYINESFCKSYVNGADIVVSNPDFNIVITTMFIASILLKKDGILAVLAPTNLLPLNKRRKWKFLEVLGFQHKSSKVLGFLPFSKEPRKSNISVGVTWHVLHKNKETNIFDPTQISLLGSHEDLQEKAMLIYRKACGLITSRIQKELALLEIQDFFKEHMQVSTFIADNDMETLALQFVTPDKIFLRQPKHLSLWENHLRVTFPFLVKLDRDTMPAVTAAKYSEIIVQAKRLRDIVNNIPKDAWENFKASYDLSSIKNLHSFGVILLDLAGNPSSLENPYKPPRPSKKRERHEPESLAESEHMYLQEQLEKRDYASIAKFLNKKGY